jgi:hypothetical protein
MTSWTYCRPGVFTRVYGGPSPWGFVYVWAASPPAQVTYREYSSSPPFYLEEGLTVGQKTTLVVGPTPYLEIQINPRGPGYFRVT